MASARGDDLTRVPLSPPLTAEDRDAVAGTSTVETFPAGIALVHEGRAGYAFYVVAEGQVEVAQAGRDGPPSRPRGLLRRNRDHRQRPTERHLTATTPTVAWTMFGTEFLVLQQDLPDVAAALLRAMEHRLARETLPP